MFEKSKNVLQFFQSCKEQEEVAALIYHLYDWIDSYLIMSIK